MLKRVGVADLRSGMFIEAIEGMWEERHLQRRRFLLRGEAALRSLKSGPAHTIVINTSKGLDVSSSPDVETIDADARHAMDTADARRTVEDASRKLSGLLLTLKNGGSISEAEAAPIVHKISKAIDHNPSLFINVTRLKSKDETTFLHSISVSALMIHFGRYLGMDEHTVRLLGMGGLLHDVGKVEVPLEILSKDGKLTAEEMAIMRGHPEIGYGLLCRQEGMPGMVLDICRYHHERIDGNGYPSRLSGAKLSLAARIAAICDVYDAVTSTRPYRNPWTPGRALGWMMEQEGQFDRRLLKKFVICLSVSLTTRD